jgi:hypothetical protein
MSEYPSTPKPAPDGLLVTPVWTTVTTSFDAMTEQRKAKQVFAKYDVSLKYPEGMTNADIMTLWAFYMARKGAYQAFYIYDLLSLAHTGLFVGWGDGETTIFDLPGKSTSDQTIYKDGVAVDLSAAGASGSVDLADMRLSLVDGAAFVDFSAAGALTPFLNHKLTITDSAGKKAIGYIKAAGTGETLGDELITNVINLGSNAYETFVKNANNKDIDSAINTSGSGVIYTNDIATMTDKLFKATVDITLNSGTAPSLYCKCGTASINFVVKNRVTSGDYYIPGATAQGTATGILLYNNATTSNFSMVWSLKQVLTPSSTGVTITSTPGGTTYNWTSIEAGFNYNDGAGYTYEISAGVVLEGGGAEDSDRISFSVPPALGVLITCDLTGYLRMRVRFKEDKFSRQSLTHLISSGGTIELKGLSPEDL